MPAYLRNGRFDILAANDLGRALYSPLYDQAGDGKLPNSARFVFLDPVAADFFLDYDKAANDCVAFLRAEAGRDPYDKLTLNSKARRSVHSSSIIGRARCPHLTCSKD